MTVCRNCRSNPHRLRWRHRLPSHPYPCSRVGYLAGTQFCFYPSWHSHPLHPHPTPRARLCPVEDYDCWGRPTDHQTRSRRVEFVLQTPWWTLPCISVRSQEQAVKDTNERMARFVSYALFSINSLQLIDTTQAFAYDYVPTLVSSVGAGLTLSWLGLSDPAQGDPSRPSAALWEGKN